MSTANVERCKDGVLSVGYGADSITPSDSAAVAFRAIYVGGTGDVKVTAIDGSVATFKSCPVGLIIPVAVKLVWSTGTTATLLVGIS